MSKIQNLCLLRLSAIGDVCHAVAMVERIQRFRPNVKITWIIGKLEHQLIGDIPGIRFVIFDKSLGRRAFTTLQHDLAGQEFDALLLMQVALRANIAASKIKAKVKIGFDWSRSKELHWLFANRRIKSEKHAHVLDGFMGFADALGLPVIDKPVWHIPISEKDKGWATVQRSQLGEFVIVSPAASKAERNWLPERYAMVIDHLYSKGIKTVLCGGPGRLDRELDDQIMSYTKNVTRDYIGQTNLKQMLALIGEARLVIAPDTGPTHMATAMRTRVIGLYAHSNPLRTGPYNDLDKVVSVYDEVIEEQYGKDWRHLKWGIRAKGKDLMARISVTDVIRQVDETLELEDDSE